MQLFQYHTGPIKRVAEPPWAVEVELEFQYHTGPIKRHVVLIHCDVDLNPCFNTTLVQLKEQYQK